MPKTIAQILGATEQYSYMTPPQQKSIARIFGAKEEYPLWLYHRSLPGVIVEDWEEEEQVKRAEGWDITAQERAEIDNAQDLAKMLLQATILKGRR